MQRYLAGEPVLAAPPSARYRLSKFARKHRAPLTTAAIALVLLAGVAVSVWQAVRATNAEAVAVEAQKAEAERAEGERLAKLDAEAKKADAERAQLRAEAGEKLAGERLVQVEAEKKKADEEKQIADAVKFFLPRPGVSGCRQAGPGRAAHDGELDIDTREYITLEVNQILGILLHIVGMNPADTSARGLPR